MTAVGIIADLDLLSVPRLCVGVYSTARALQQIIHLVLIRGFASKVIRRPHIDYEDLRTSLQCAVYGEEPTVLATQLLSCSPTLTLLPCDLMDIAPPAYASQENANTADLLGLPDNALLLILGNCSSSELHSVMRQVCKKLYTASMAILRSIYVDQYAQHVKFPYTSAPLAARERKSFDLFIALLAATQRLSAESSLHILPLYAGSVPKELFELYQPRSRLEDLCEGPP